MLLRRTAPPRSLSALMTAHNIDRLDEIEYPQGIKSPKTELNQNAKDGKFRQVWTLIPRRHLAEIIFLSLGTTEISFYNSCRSVD